MKTLYRTTLAIEPKSTTHQAKDITARWYPQCPTCKKRYKKQQQVQCPYCKALLPMSISDSKSLRLVKAHYEGAVTACPNLPDVPISAPVVLAMYFGFPHPTSTPASHITSKRWKRTKPDASNLAKTFEDVLVRCGVLADDNLVVACFGVKYYTPNPCIDVVICRAPGLNPGMPIVDQLTVAALYDSGEDAHIDTPDLFAQN